MSFSALDRHKHLAVLSDQHWDLVIIGGGITGAGILLDAVSRGLKAALIEKDDFAAGTSSRSTKLIHGGLRYLKNFEIGLVREVGRERAIVYANARHLVRPEPMLLPFYHDGSIGRLTGSIGLWFYDWLADVDKTERRKMLSREETIAQEPLLRREGLLGSGLYYEYRTDDARLTLSILKKAVSMGANALNYCEATGFLYSNNKISGVRCKDGFTENDVIINSHVVVNATGPWLDSVLNLQEEKIRENKILLSKGVHIVVPRMTLPIRQSMYFDTPEDGRMIFCIPRDQSVYIGTTDTLYQSELNELGVHDDETQYLLDAVNHVVADVQVSKEQIIGSWAGVRPLIYEEGKSPSELSRKDEVFVSSLGLISIAGGKLTGYRKMAERIVDLVMKSEKLNHLVNRECNTQELRLAGADFDSEEEIQVMLDRLTNEFSRFSRVQIEKLFFRYGREARAILHNTEDIGSMTSESLITSEVAFAIGNEMTHTISDFLYRRTADIYFDQEYLRRQMTQICNAFGSVMHWDSQRCEEELLLAQRLLERPY